MDLATLKIINGNKVGVPYETYLPHLNQALRDANCTTVLRVAHFMGQILHESGNLIYMREIHDGSNYEGRTDLNNIYPGDGKRFRGRGVIQLTGRYNYTQFSKWAHSKGMVSSPTYFVDNPVELEQPQWAFRVASYYWTVARNINPLADRDDLTAVTKAVNGGTRGIDDRRLNYNRAKTQGSKILPSGGGGGYVSSRALDYYNVEPDATQLTRAYTAGRGGKKIQYVTIHHMAGDMNLSSCVALWNKNMNASAHYTVNSTGGVGQAVYDSNTAWSNGNAASNQVSVSIEHANITRQVNGNDADRNSWKISDATIIGGARLTASLCLYYKLGRPVWGKNVRPHREFRQTFCPGHLSAGMQYNARYVQEAQSFYDKLVAGSVHPDGTPKKGKVEDDMFSDNDRLMLAEIRNQLTGSHDTKKFPGWKQLGDKSVTDALADVRNEVRQIGDQLAGYERDDRGARKFSGWPNIDGNGGKTIVEALAEVQKAVKSIQDSIEKGS